MIILHHQYTKAFRLIPMALILLTLCANAQPLSSAFNYQGELIDQGIPAQGLYDFEFRLFNAETGGTQAGPDIQITSVFVSEGIFSLELDFGFSPFSNSATTHWLEIGVHLTGDGEPATLLEPRQVITAVPYALHSEFVPAGSIGSNEIDTNSVQNRINGSCTSGSSIRTVSATGAVTCQIDDDGTSAVSSHANDVAAHHAQQWFAPDASSLYTPDNFVGINVSEPEATLHINDSGSTRPALLIEAATGSEGDIAWPTGEFLQLGTWNEAALEFSRHMTLLDDGLVFINNRLYFNGDTGDKISLFNDRFGQANMYGFGVGDNAVMYMKANTGYEFYVGDADVTTSLPSMYLSDNGLGINTTNLSGYTLAVNGDIRSKEIVVETGWSDFVFEPDYQLRSLTEVDEFIQTHGHLPDIPSAAEVAAHGVRVGEMESSLLQKIEELTLYAIDMQKRLALLERQNQYLLDREE